MDTPQRLVTDGRLAYATQRGDLSAGIGVKWYVIGPFLTAQGYATNAGQLPMDADQ